MTRGKHAASASKRRAEAALQIAESLAEKNAALAMRAKRVETDAATVPALRARIRELETQLEQLETPRLRQVREQAEAREAHLRDLLHRTGQYLQAVVDNATLLIPGDREFLPRGLIDDTEFRKATGLTLRLEGEWNRDVRRTQMFLRTVGDRNGATRDTPRDKASYGQKELAPRVRGRRPPRFTSLADAAIAEVRSTKEVTA